MPSLHQAVYSGTVYHMHVSLTHAAVHLTSCIVYERVVTVIELCLLLHVCLHSTATLLLTSLRRSLPLLYSGMILFLGKQVQSTTCLCTMTTAHVLLALLCSYCLLLVQAIVQVSATPEAVSEAPSEKLHQTQGIYVYMCSGSAYNHKYSWYLSCT